MPEAAQPSFSNPGASILGVWLPPAQQMQQSSDQEPAEARQITAPPHDAVSLSQTTPGTCQDSIARRTRSRTREDACSAAAAQGAVAAPFSTHTPAGRILSQACPAASDIGAAEPALRIAVAYAQPHAATGSSASSGRSKADMPSAAADMPAPPPLLQGVWLAGRRLSPSACHVILYQQPAAGRSHLSVAATTGSVGSSQSPAATAAAAARSSTAGDALQWAVGSMNRSRQLVSALAAVQASPAAAAQRQQARLQQPADAPQPGAAVEEGGDATLPSATGLLAHSELLYELRRFRRRCQAGRGQHSIQLHPASASPSPGALPPTAASGTAAGGVPESPADAAAADAYTLHKSQRRSAALLSHAAGAGAGCWLLAQRQRVAEAVRGRAASLAWGFIDPQASLVQIASGIHKSLLQHCTATQACGRPANHAVWELEDIPILETPVAAK